LELTIRPITGGKGRRRGKKQNFLRKYRGEPVAKSERKRTAMTHLIYLHDETLKQFEPTGREKTELEMKESGFSPTDFLMDFRTCTGIPENKCTARKK